MSSKNPLGYFEYVGGLNNGQKNKKTTKNPKWHFLLGHPVEYPWSVSISIINVDFLLNLPKYPFVAKYFRLFLTSTVLNRS